MILKVNNRRYDFFDSVAVNLRFGTVASSFSFGLYFNPDNPAHRELCRPFGYQKCTLEQAGATILTGNLVTPTFTASAQDELQSVSGYSSTGVLEACEIPVSLYPLQTTGISLKSITERLLKPFGLKLVVDSSVSSLVNKNYASITATHGQSIKSFLAELAGQRNVVLSHTEKGELLYTRANTAAEPIGELQDGGPDYRITATYDGDALHSTVTAIRQASKAHPNAGQSTLTNPLVAGAYRPRVVRQTAGDDIATPQAAHNLLAEELRNAVRVVVELTGWNINGKRVHPGQTVYITSPKNYLYNRTLFFIDEVQLNSNAADGDTAVLTCVLPEVYNGKAPKNIFA